LLSNFGPHVFVLGVEAAEPIFKRINIVDLKFALPDSIYARHHFESALSNWCRTLFLRDQRQEARGWMVELCSGGNGSGPSATPSRAAFAPMNHFQPWRSVKTQTSTAWVAALLLAGISAASAAPSGCFTRG
jgi:hypothetical protein